MRILAIDPVDESAHRALMSIYARKHRYGLAVRQYQICREVLDRELNVEPELETRQLHSGNYQAQAEGLGREAEKCQRSVRNRSLPPPPTCPVISALNKFWRD